MQEQVYGPILFYYNNNPSKPIRQLFIDRVLNECITWSRYCMLWVGSVGGTSQPQMNVTYSTGQSSNVSVARLMYQYEHGAIDRGVHIFKQCFNERCINPKHYVTRN